MSKIRDAKGRLDGENSGYTRVLGNVALGQLLSRVQATVIANGNELERLIAERCTQIADIDEFIDNATMGKIKNGVYLCLKKTFKKSKKYSKGVEKIEPDMLIFIVQEYRVCKIIELKDGDAFDTKKSQAEKEHLEKFATIFGSKIPFSTNYYICSFNQEKREMIKIGFKNVFDDEHILTGRELCEILCIQYNEIIAIRERDRRDNLDYFIEQLLLIPEIETELQNRLD
ncbi:hypothetical protein [Kingella sp. (in: b-proteobacteria)]|uniref:hypothetical protein n=1 Tax=Kingella sp. (in: b-proteobacteria) TaxID=2020713 RepID=UPI0026DC4B0B|nr:hypothetical protein [Kingella sp. (in: b-proteobacteria)]MDO4658598.1 hypothetical protein [Kingella sp. (in: b-proteobacteria)]